MRWVAVGLLLFACAHVAHAASDSSADEKRVALVIGNSNYPTGALRNTVNDATAIAGKLRELGFEVILRTDVGQRQMTRAITEFAGKLPSGSVGLFYYAGHGIQSRGRNYLVPVDAEIISEGTVSSESVDVERVLDQLAPARLAMLVLDASRTTPFDRRFRSAAGQGLAQIDAPAGTLIAYATAPGKVTADRDGTIGTYTEALLDALDKPGLKIEDVFKHVRIRVLKMTANQQIPWESSSLTGQFFFQPAKVTLQENIAQKKLEQKKLEAETAVLRQQMDLVKTEMSKLQELTATSAAATDNAQERKKAEDEAAALRNQLTSLSSEVSRLRESGEAAALSEQDRQKAAKTSAALREQLALLNDEAARLRASPAHAGPSDQAAAWKKQLAKLDPQRGKLTFTTAMVTLLDITEEADLSKVRAFEQQVQRRPHHTAFALGADANGLLVWAGAYAQQSRDDAMEVAVDFCAVTSASRCKVVFDNGKFSEVGWLAVVSQLASQPVEGVRRAFMSSLSQPVLENHAGRSGFGGSRSVASKAYTFTR